MDNPEQVNPTPPSKVAPQKKEPDISPPVEGKAGKDAKRLQGVWQVTRGETNGRELKGFEGMRLTFKKKEVY
jgi:hypothetical protein